ncbi:ferredoxin [Mycobacterium alsense]|uniref:Ferredoxin n=1 Tax=Mycobacterium alsense TaxID=324058 RepID=A0ABD6P0R2_9MYCO|nr:ferredoxin--NADP reductase [Mycobacterium alsense]OBG38006.1 ferredoxin [Mycobacterium alsense]
MGQPGGGPDSQDDSAANGFAPLRIKQVVRETGDAVSLVFDVPAPHRPRFCYQAGQFLTLRVHVNGLEHRRCYSMSSSPMAGEDLRITVKRDPGGVVSNWLNDTATAGGEIHAAPPAGRFVLSDTNRDVVAFAGGSGITPVFSLIRWALANTTRTIRLFYANRSRESVIFAGALARLADRHPDRLVIEHHLDEDRGVVHAGHVERFVGRPDDVDVYICGPAAFMDTVEATVVGAGVPADRVRLERFDTPDVAAAAANGPAVTATERVTIHLDRQRTTVAYRDGETLLQTARSAGLRAPSSCETGSCGTCMARLTEGSARMINNDALTADEVAEGWVLTCQSLPTSRTITVVYE